MSNLQLLDRAASATMCQILGTFGAGLVGAAAYPLWTPKGQLVALGAGSLAMLAANYACPPMDIGDAPSPDDRIDGCGQMAPGGWGQFQYNAGDGWIDVTRYGWFTKAHVITRVYTDLRPSSGKYTANAEVMGEGGGSPYAVGEFDTQAEADSVVFRIDPRSGVCAYDPEVPIPPPPEDISNPIEYTDNTTNCTYNVSLQGFAQVYEGGPVNPVFLIEGTETQRAEGGRIGGCNFAPVIYMPNPGGDGGGGGGDGPGVTFPVPDDGPGGGGDVPWWLPPLVGGVTSAVLNQILRILGGDGSGGGGTITPSSFTMVAPCDVDEEGNSQQRTWEFDQENLLGRMIQHQVGMMDMLQQHLVWKTPTCGNAKPDLEGEWVTTRWLSTEKMDHSGVRLRKLFRYRTKSTRNLGQLSAYWEAFTWEAGPVCVQHKGAWWGTPQIWAATEEEGQRVIRFAAAEAGIDPDQVGEWGISSSRAPRYGMSGTMTIHLKEGFPWISARESADWPNTLARAHAPYGS